ncbi:hypothetical protein CHARACLAT_027800 [Characodon lateralis]|uniref:Uncharacterized protein n=1 Tax=Characodon lateralis TaxID=208331 RepID=A0ABU7E443_9TELE|nr:hypothetical protein [Characodon lateralis]
MAPVFGHATATARILCKFLFTVIAIFVVIFAQLSPRFAPGYVSVLLFYDCTSLFGIKESIESLFSDWGKYNQNFLPPLVFLPDLPENLFLSGIREERRKLGLAF